MVKRKAKDVENDIPAEEPRRSSRRVATAKEIVPEKKSKPTSASKTAKKVQKSTKEVSTEANGESGKSPDTVGAFNQFIVFSSSLVLQPLFNTGHVCGYR
jgi:hypothetical protein